MIASSSIPPVPSAVPSSWRARLIHHHVGSSTLLFLGITYGYHAVILLAAIAHLPSRMLTIPCRAFILMLSIWVLWGSRSRLLAVLRRDWVWRAFALYWSLYLVRLALDLFISPVDLRLEKADYLHLALGGTLLPALAFIRQPGLEGLRLVGALFIAAGAVTTALSAWIFRHFIGSSFGRINVEQTDIAFGSINAGYLASSLALLGLYLMLRKLGAWRALIGPTLLVIAVVPLALSAARGPVMAIGVCTILLISTQLRARGNLRVGVVAVALACGIPLFLDFLAYSGSNMLQRFALLRDRGLDEANVRTAYWADAWEQFLAHPILGSGLEEQYSLMYPHNIVIESFMATGIFGGIAFTLFLATVSIRAVRLMRRPHIFGPAGWIPLMFLHYAAMGMVSGAIYTNVMFWGFAVAVIRLWETARHTPMGTPSFAPVRPHTPTAWAPR